MDMYTSFPENSFSLVQNYTALKIDTQKKLFAITKMTLRNFVLSSNISNQPANEDASVIVGKQKGNFAAVNISPSKTFQTNILPSHSTTILELVSRMSITNTISPAEPTFTSASVTVTKYATSSKKSVDTHFKGATRNQINMNSTALSSRYHRTEFVIKTIDIATKYSLTKKLFATVPSVSKNIVSYRFSHPAHSSNPEETTDQRFFCYKNEGQMHFVGSKSLSGMGQIIKIKVV